MDRLAALELYVRIVDRGGFGAAAADLGVSRPAATAAIQSLERRLGVRLLHRTTRRLSPTAEGLAYYRRCVAILAEIEDADRSAGGTMMGTVRVDVVGHLARKFLLPALPAFLAAHPGLRVHLSEGERFVDLLREGVDCVVRAGALADSGLVARRLGLYEEITCASPAYLKERGVPRQPDDLHGHEMVGFVSSRTGQPLPLEFTVAGKVVEIALPARLLVSTANSYAEAALRGFGLIQAPRHRLQPDVEAGALVEILAECPPTPTPIAILFPSGRLSPRVRIFVDWLFETLRPNYGEG